MAQRDNEYDRNRDDEDYRNQRDPQHQQERTVEQRGYRQRSSDYGSHAGWGGQGFSQGSFGEYGGQGDNMYNRYGGTTGSGYQSGYGRGGTFGGGMNTYVATPDQGRRQDEDNRNQQQYTGREGGWGGYGSYDRERSGERRFDNPDRGGYYRSHNHDQQQHDRDRNFYAQDPWESSRQQFGGYYPGSPYGSSQYGNTGSSNMGYQGGNQSGQSHFGRGPKGYQRSDERIREDVNEQLTRHHHIDASDIEVEVQNGEVTLKGTVDQRHVKRLAEDVAEQVSGVRQVHNHLRVDHSQGNVGGQSILSGSRSTDKSTANDSPTTSSLLGNRK